MDFAFGNSNKTDSKTEVDLNESIAESTVTNTSWLGSVMSSGTKKDNSGLLDEGDEDDRLITSSDSTNDDLEGQRKQKRNYENDDNKYFKSAKSYHNTKVAIVFALLGVVMLIFAFLGLPLIMLFPGSFLRNMSLGSMFMFLSLAFYMGPYNYGKYLMSEQGISLASLSYLA